MKDTSHKATFIKGRSNWGQGRGGRPWRSIVDKVKARDQYQCQQCQRLTIDGEVDHITPIAKGGTDNLENLQWLCRAPCHRDKTITEAGGKIRQEIGVDGWPV